MNGRHELFVISMNERQTEPRQILTREGSQIPTGWTQDSSALLFQEAEALNLPSDILMVKLDGSEPEVLLEGPADESEAALSPDGAWLAFVSTKDGQQPGDLYVDRYPPTGRAIRITSTGARRPQWDPRPEQFRLYYRGGGGSNIGPNPQPLHMATLSLPAENAPGQNPIASAEDLSWETDEVVPTGNPLRLIRVAPDGRILIMDSGDQIASGYLQSPAAADHFVYVTNFLQMVERLTSGR